MLSSMNMSNILTEDKSFQNLHPHIYSKSYHAHSSISSYYMPSISNYEMNNNLIINYLPYDIDETQLEVLFQVCGEILNLKVVKDNYTKKSIGYGFVKFVSTESAYEAINKYNGYTIRGKRLKVSFAREQTEDNRPSKVFISNLPVGYSDAECSEICRKYGNVIECRVISKINQQGKTSIHAFVLFDFGSEADRALVGLNGFVIPGTHRQLHARLCKDSSKYSSQQSDKVQYPPYHNQIKLGSFDSTSSDNDSVQPIIGAYSANEAFYQCPYYMHPSQQCAISEWVSSTPAHGIPSYPYITHYLIPHVYYINGSNGVIYQTMRTTVSQDHCY